jgi:hypothetical protein
MPLNLPPSGTRRTPSNFETPIKTFVDGLETVNNTQATQIAAQATTQTSQGQQITALNQSMTTKVSVDPVTGKIPATMVEGIDARGEYAKQLSVAAPALGDVPGALPYRTPTVLARMQLVSDTPVTSGTYTVRMKRASGVVLGTVTLTSGQTIGTPLVATAGTSGTAYGIARSAVELLFVEITTVGAGATGLTLLVTDDPVLAVSTDPAAPTVLTDTFTGSDGSAPNAAIWTPHAPTGGSISIQGNRLRFVSGTAGNYATSAVGALVAVPGMTARQNMRITGTANLQTDEFAAMEIGVRGSGGTRYDQNAYQLHLDFKLNRFKLWKVVNGGGIEFPETVITSKTLGILTDVRFKLEVIGTTIRAKVWTTGNEPASWDFTVTDTAVNASGVVYVRSSGGIGTGAQTTFLDTVTVDLL